MTARTPDLRSLELLVTVIEAGSIGAAARSLGVSQPAASQRLRALERQLGVILCTRSPTGVKATPAGMAVADRARQVLAAAGGLDLLVDALRADLAAHLKVAASLTIAEYLLPGWLRALRASDRTGSVTLEVANSSEVVAAVVDRRAALGFVEGARVPKSLHTRVVGTDELVVVVAPQHRLARRRPPSTSLDELASMPLVTRERGSGTREVIEEAIAARQTGSKAPVARRESRVTLELGSSSLLKSAAMAGEGPAVLSRLAVVEEIAAGTLVEVPLAEGPLRRRFRAVWRSDRTPQGAAATLLEIAGRAERGVGPIRDDQRAETRRPRARAER